MTAPFAIDIALASSNTAHARQLHALFDEVMQANRKASERARRMGEPRIAERFESEANSTDSNGAYWLNAVARRAEDVTQKMETGR